MATTHMDLDYTEEGYELAKQLGETIAIAAAMMMIKRARQESIPTIQYTKHFQEKYVHENQEKLKPILKQRFVASCQDEVLEKLRRALPAAHPCELMQQKQSTEGCSVDWLDEWCADSEEKQQPKPFVETKPLFPPQQLFKAEDSTLKNIKFVESMLRLSEYSEQNRMISTSELHSLLYTEADLRQHSQSLNFHNDHHRLTEDSGFGGSESVRSHSADFVSGNVVRYNMQTLNNDQLMLQSAALIVDYVSREMSHKTFEVFYNWNQSLLEHACHILNKFSHTSEDCREILLDFVLNVLEDIWCDEKSSQHHTWEIKSHFVTNLLSTAENCYETLHYICEKCTMFRKAFVQKTKDYSMMAEKLNVLLNLYCSICNIVLQLEMESKDSGRNKVKPEESEDVTLLWKEKWGETTDREEDGQEMYNELEKQIEGFEVLMISLSNKYPLLVMLLVEAVEAAKHLRSQCGYSTQEEFL